MAAGIAASSPFEQRDLEEREPGLGVVGLELGPALERGGGRVVVFLGLVELAEGLPDERLLLLGDAVEALDEHLAGVGELPLPDQDRGPGDGEDRLRAGGPGRLVEHLLGLAEPAQVGQQVGPGQPERGRPWASCRRPS